MELSQEQIDIIDLKSRLSKAEDTIKKFWDLNDRIDKIEDKLGVHGL